MVHLYIRPDFHFGGSSIPASGGNRISRVHRAPLRRPRKVHRYTVGHASPNWQRQKEKRPPALPQAAQVYREETPKEGSDSGACGRGPPPHSLSKMIAISGSIERR